MTLNVAFHADTASSSVAQAAAWATQEPLWVLAEVIGTTEVRHAWWHVTVRLEPVQEVLGL